MRKSIALFCFPFLATVACSASHDDAGETVGTRTDAVISCSAADLGGTAPEAACTGPWRFQEWSAPCYASAATAECGMTLVADACERDASCNHQVGTVTQTFDVTVHGFPIRERECHDGHNHEVCRNVVTGYDVPGACEAHARSERDRLRGAVARGMVVSSDGRRGTCRVTVDGVPNFQDVPDPSCGRERFACYLPMTCRTPVHGPDPNVAACGPSGTFLLSDVGLTLAELTASEGSRLVTGASADVNPYCSTESDIPVEGRVSARFEALRLVYERAMIDLRIGADTAAAMRALAVSGREIRLVAELFGAQLSRAQRDETMRIIADTSDAQNACGSTWAPPSGLSGCELPASTRATLTFCQRLLEPHAPSSSAAAFMSHCVAAGLEVSRNGAPVACIERVRGVEHDTSLAVLEKGLASPDTLVGPERATRLRERLALLTGWYADHAQVTGGASTLGDASRLTAAYWRGVHMKDFGGLDEQAKLEGSAPSHTSIASALDGIAAGEHAAEREVLAAAYGPASGAAIRPGAPVLLVTAAALRPIYDRAREVAALRDLGCSLADCVPSMDRPIDVVLKTVAALPRGEAFDQLLQKLPPGAYRDLFATISAGRQVFEASVAHATGRAYAASDVTSRVDLPELTGIAAIVTDAAASTVRLAEGGLATRDLHDRLMVGIQEEKRQAIRDLVKARRDATTAAVLSYETNRGRVLGELLRGATVDNAASSAATRMRVATTRFDDLSVDLAAARGGFANDELVFGNFVAGLRGASASASSVYRVVESTTINVPAKTTVDRAWAAVDQIAARHAGGVFRLGLGAGDLATFSATGQWSPTCSLRRVGAPGLQSNLGIEGAVTGSEGFSMQRTGSTYSATSSSVARTRSTSHSRGQSESTCTTSVTSGSLALSFYGLGGGQRWSREAQDCDREDWSWGSSDSSTQAATSGADTRASATFSAGIRAASSPYPGMPVGALLAVTMPHDDAQRGHELDVRVVTGRMATTAPVAADVYLVVNDVGGCNDVSGQLTVDAARLQSSGAIAAALSPAVDAAIAQLRRTANEYLRTTAMSVEQANVLRSTFFAAIEAAIAGRDLGALQGADRSLLVARVDHELAQIRRKIDIALLERQRRIAMLELKQLGDDLATAGAQSQFAALATRWAIEGFDHAQLGAVLAGLREATSDLLLPLAKLRYPEALTALRGNATAMGYARNLSTATLSTPATTLARDANGLVGALIDAIDGAALVQPTGAQVTSDVALSFPNPFAQSSTLSPFRKADPATSRALWESIRGGGGVSFAVTPELLYDKHLGAAALSCHQAVPVVSGLAAYVAMGESVEAMAGQNRVPWVLPVAMGDAMVFPTASGRREVTFGNRDWLAGTGLRVLFGPADQAGLVFSQHFDSSQGQAGLSPFVRIDTTFARLVEAYGERMRSAQEVILYYRLQGRSIAAPGLRDVATCR